MAASTSSMTDGRSDSESNPQPDKAGLIPTPTKAPTQGIGNRRDLESALLVICLPLFVFSASLVSITFFRRVKHDSTASPLGYSFDPRENDTASYYLQISSTTWALLASFSSSVAPILVGFLMTVVS